MSNKYLNPKHISRKHWIGAVLGAGFSMISQRVLGTSIAELDSNNSEGWRGLFPLDPNLTFLNNGTTGPSPYSVITEVEKYLWKVEEEAAYWHFAKEVKNALAQSFGGTEAEYALTHNVTEGINIMAHGLTLTKGDEILLCTHEHAGNIIPWMNVKKLKGIELKFIDPNPQAEALLQQVKKACSAKTKVIALPHIPCTTGQVFPIKAICEWANSKNIKTLIDGAHGPGMLPLNLVELGCDAYASCFHKWLLGPKGCGFLYVRKGFQPELTPQFVGAYSTTAYDTTDKEPQFENYVDNAHRYHYATQNAALEKGMVKALEFHRELGIENTTNHIKSLNNYLFVEVGKLEKKGWLKILNSPESESRAGVLSFVPQKLDFNAIYKSLRQDQIVVRSVAENKLNAIRVSTHIYNSEKDIDTFLNALIQLHK